MLNYPAFTNNEFCKVEDLKISILDLGFIHSDATYDVLAVKNREFVNLDAHIKRFINSCNGWRIPLKYAYEDIEAILRVMLAKLDSTYPQDLLVWIAVTRGIPKSGNPRDLESCEPNFYAYMKPYFGFNRNNTATVCLSKQQRNTAFDQRMKNFAWNDLTLAQWEAIDRGYDTAVLLDSRGFLTEGPGFNVAIVKDEIIYAPKHNRLDGTVMNQVEQLCAFNNKSFNWAAISADDIENCDAMFLTSTAGNVINVSCFENKYFNESEIITWLQNTI